ncbi:MAG: hypothetical protein DMG46_23410 [Acidobacteria bacterium]|nr:MAG: hypothetical protein DMG46_23410 [Acidobacteriota bacterium]
MTDQPPSDRFKSEMPQIPGVSGPGSRATTAPNPAVKLVLGLLAVLLVVFLGARWALRPKHAAPQSVEQQPQIEVPSPAPDPSTLLPHATDADPGIASVAEMAKPWSSKEFFIRNRLSGENISGLLVRLPTGSPSQSTGYWAFAQKAPFGDCTSYGGKPLQPHGVRSAQIEQSSRKRLGARRDCSRLRSAPAPGYRNKSGGQKDTRRKSGVKRLRVTLRVYCGQIAIRPVPLDSCATQT